MDPDEGEGTEPLLFWGVMSHDDQKTRDIVKWAEGKDAEASKAYREASVALAKEIIGHAASPVAAAFIASALSGDSRAQIRALEDLGILKAQASGGAVVPVQVNIGVNITTAPPEDRVKFREDCVAAYSRMRPSAN